MEMRTLPSNEGHGVKKNVLVPQLFLATANSLRKQRSTTRRTSIIFPENNNGQENSPLLGGVRGGQKITLAHNSFVPFQLKVCGVNCNPIHAGQVLFFREQ